MNDGDPLQKTTHSWTFGISPVVSKSWLARLASLAHGSGHRQDYNFDAVFDERLG